MAEEVVMLLAPAMMMKAVQRLVRNMEEMLLLSIIVLMTLKSLLRDFSIQLRLRGNSREERSK